MATGQREAQGNLRDGALAYLALGWCVLPVLYRDKAPGWPDKPAGKPYKQTGWQALRLTASDVARYFQAPTNIGVLLGDASGGLVDVDLDCAEAVELAPRFLPGTWTYGRPSKPRSHWLYLAPGAPFEQFKDKSKLAENKDATLVELRASDESKGRQTVFPPSVHTSGERIEWTPDDADTQETPTPMDAAELRAQVATLAAACLVLRHGGRAAAMAWLDGGPCPSLPDNVARQVREWWELPNVKPEPKRHRSTRAPQESADFARAVESYNLANARDWQAVGGFERRCPMCNTGDDKHGVACFGPLPAEPSRWSCFSAGHEARCPTAGRPGPSGDCWTGDSLDVDAHSAGVTRAELLRRNGYLKAR